MTLSKSQSSGSFRKQNAINKSNADELFDLFSSMEQQKLNLEETQLYLSSKFINYEKMNEIEIKKCIYLLKTRLKLQNKSLLTDLINIFLRKKNTDLIRIRK